MALSPANRRRSNITPPRLIIATGVVLALAVGAWLLLKPKTDVIPYRMAEVTRGDVTSSVSASGKLQALVTVDVGSQISGQIKTINVDFNDKVKKGQVLATIDPLTYTSRDPRLQIFAEKALPHDLTLRAEIYSITGSAEQGRRILYNVSQTNGAIYRTESYTETKDTRFVMRLRGNF